MRKMDSRTSANWRRALWLTLLVAASVGFSLGLACAMPFAALGAAAALTLDRRDAMILTGAAWFANQLVGFSLLGYPWTGETFAWGIVLGVVAILTTGSAQAILWRFERHAIAAVACASFLGAFAVYEGGLFVVATALLGGTEDFEFSIVMYILEINAAAFVGLLVLHRLGTAAGLAIRPALGHLATEPRA